MEAVPFLYKIIKIRKIQLSDGCKRSKIAFIGKKVCTVSNNVIQSIEQNKLVRKGKLAVPVVWKPMTFSFSHRLYFP